MAEGERTIRLLHVTTVPESLDFLSGQAGYMRERGFEVHALSSPGDMLRRFGTRERVAVHAVPMARRISPVDDVAALRKMRRVMLDVAPDIVHAHTPKGGLLGTLAARLAGVPVRIYHIHGLPFVTARGFHRMLLLASERVACGSATRVLSVSRSVMEVVVRHRLCPPSKIESPGPGSINGVDAQRKFNPALVGSAAREESRARFGIPPDALVVGFIGRIVRDKGLVELTGAWDALRDAYPRLHLLIVGPFEVRDPVPPKTERVLRSDPRIHLAGLDWNTPPLYAAMDVVTLPSYREGFPSVPLEAAAMGLPVVATNVPGCADAVVDGETGLLVDAGDAAALAGSIRRYIDDPDLRRLHGEAGRERVLRRFQPRSVWRALHEVYIHALDAVPHDGTLGAEPDSRKVVGMR